MAKITFTRAEITEMKRASAIGHSEWDYLKVATIKQKIKSQKLISQKNICCYCQRDITAEYNLVLDIEHIIPKSARLKLMFRMKNLSVSCKRCNMKIKGKNLDFLSMPLVSLPKNTLKSKYYKFIHPNLDKQHKHLTRVSIQILDKILVKYIVKNDSEKGKYTYEYFKLKEFEKDSFDAAQGKNMKKILNPSIEELFNNLKVI